MVVTKWDEVDEVDIRNLGGGVGPVFAWSGQEVCKGLRLQEPY